MSRLRLVCVLAFVAAGRVMADEAGSLGLALKTLGYDEAIGARFSSNPIVVLMVGGTCTRFPQVTLAGRALVCDSVSPETTRLVEDATRRAAILVFTDEAQDAIKLAPVALDARLTVVSLTATHRSSAMLVSTDASGKLFLGQLAIQVLGARFPSSVLRLATIVPPLATMPEPLPEDADPPQPDANNEVPRYPEDARARGVEGVVVLRVGIGSNGRVSLVEPIKGEPQFVDAAVLAARTWRYVPAKLDGVPIAATIIVKVPFRIGRGASNFSEE